MTAAEQKEHEWMAGLLASRSSFEGWEVSQTRCEPHWTSMWNHTLSSPGGRLYLITYGEDRDGPFLPYLRIWYSGMPLWDDEAEHYRNPDDIAYFSISEALTIILKHDQSQATEALIDKELESG
jgi:hypothetical protein